MNKSELFSEVWRLKDESETRRTPLALRYADAWGYYRGDLPAPRANSGDLPPRKIMKQAFDSIYPSLIALFTDSQKSPVAFDSDAEGNADLAAAVTTAIHNAALKTNNAYKMYLKAIKEMLISGDQAAAVLIGSDDLVTDKHEFTDLPVAQFAAVEGLLIKGGYEVDSEIELDKEQGTVTGWVRGKKNVKFPLLRLIDFKDYYLDPEAVDSEEADYQAYAEKLTKGEAKRRGYDASVIDKGMDIDTNDGQSTDKTLLVVGDMNADDLADRPLSILDSDNDIITVWHHFWRGVYNSDKPEWWYIVSTDALIAKMEQVDYCPVFKGGMDIALGSPWSESLYDLCKAAQVSTTRALRAVQRSADGAAYGEYVYIDSQVDAKGKAALAERRPGACYPVKATGAIQKLPVNDIPQAMQVLMSTLDEDAQATIQGSAGQAQALEEDAKASGTAIALTQDKQELNENQIAKCIAETFIKPMYKRLLMVLQEIDKPFLFNGQNLPLKLINKDMGLSIDIETEYDRAQAASNLLSALQTGAQTQTLPANITSDNQYAIYKLYFQAATGQQDVSQFITAPEDMPKPSKPQQIAQAIMQVAQLRNAIAETKLAEAKVDNMTADTQKKYNDAAKDLASIDQILSEIDISKLTLGLEYLKQQADQANQVAQNTQNQQQLDNQQ